MKGPGTTENMHTLPPCLEVVVMLFVVLVVMEVDMVVLMVVGIGMQPSVPMPLPV